MPFTAAELANITNSALDYYMDKGKVFAQNIQSKPMLDAFESAAGTFPGGKGDVSLAVKSGQGGGTLTGYTHDDQVSYYNPVGTKRVNFTWKEMHIGMGLTHTELKRDGITVVESDASQSTSNKDGRETQALANILEEKMDAMAEDYAGSMDDLIHGDGTADTKAIAGIGAFILTDPDAGSTGGLSRATNSWWRNRARTTDNGNTKVTSSASNGGALLQVLQTEFRQLARYAQGGARWRMFAGSDFIGAIETELRANGNYTQDGFTSEGKVDGAMADVRFKGRRFEYDPWLDDNSKSKFCYVIDMKRIKLLYMQGEKMKKTSPARPYDRYVMYKGMTSTAVMVAQQLNTSGVYEIA
jgi:hypothetical protein